MMATDFPTKDDDKKVSLRNSNYPQFDYDFIASIKQVATLEVMKLLIYGRKQEQVKKPMALSNGSKREKLGQQDILRMDHNSNQETKQVDHQTLQV
jgi:hypothetical protein